MRKILVPTDFSDNARRAVAYALNVANAVEADLHIVHTVHTRGSAGHFLSIDDIVMRERQEELDKLVKELKPQVSAAITLTTSIIQGYVVDAILETANKQGADAIVMGTQGASGLRRWVLGSTTVELLKNNSRPLIAVPNEFTGSKSTKLCFAVDAAQLRDMSLLSPAVLLAQKLQMSVHLLHISKENAANTEVSERVHLYFQQLGMTYVNHHVQSADIEQGIKNFVKENQVDLLCVLNQTDKRSWFENLFHLSITKEMAYESEVPLLVLHVPAQA